MLNRILVPVVIQPNETNETTRAVVEDATFGNEQLLRGIPVVGHVSGTIPGTAPGSSSERLERDEAHLALRSYSRQRHSGRGVTRHDTVRLPDAPEPSC